MKNPCRVLVASVQHRYHGYTRRSLLLLAMTLLTSRVVAALVSRTTASPRRSLAMSSTQLSTVELKHTDFSKDTRQDAPPVLLLHGLLGSKRNFASIGSSLSAQLEQKRRIIGLDLRNHGENHHDWRDEMSYHAMAEDVSAFLDRQVIDSAVIVGHSMGGKVAQALALLEPARVQGLVVMDIAPVRYTEEEPHWKAVRDIIDTLSRVEVGPNVSRQQVDQQLRASIPDPALRAFCLTNLDSRGKWKINLEVIAKRLDELAGFDIDPSHKYEGDAFFIHGGQSRFVRHSYMPAIADYFPNHLLTTIRGAGHWIHAEAPDDTTALLKRFLDR